MTEFFKVKIASGVVKIPKTKKPNAKCIKCGQRFFSPARTLGFDGLECKECEK